MSIAEECRQGSAVGLKEHGFAIHPEFKVLAQHPYRGTARKNGVAPDAMGHATERRQPQRDQPAAERSRETNAQASAGVSAHCTKGDGRIQAS